MGTVFRVMGPDESCLPSMTSTGTGYEVYVRGMALFWAKVASRKHAEAPESRRAMVRQRLPL
jgi:hypothetical protein